MLGIMTRFQREMLALSEGKFICVDATHNTNRYRWSLFSLVCRNRFGRGVPVAYLIANSGTMVVLAAWLQSIRDACPSVDVHYVMSDNDDAQLGALKRVYPEARVLLCWWHVLRDWQRQIVAKRVPAEDREALKSALRRALTAEGDFELLFRDVINLGHSDFNSNFRREWWPKRETWAAAFVEAAVRSPAAIRTC